LNVFERYDFRFQKKTLKEDNQFRKKTKDNDNEQTICVKKEQHLFKLFEHVLLLFLKEFDFVSCCCAMFETQHANVFFEIDASNVV